MNISDFPPLNASLNAASALLLIAGYLLIKRRRVVAHATMMIAAFITSAVFLGCYLTYHWLRVQQGIGITRFPAGRLHQIYIPILISHSILAAAIVPLVLITLWRAATRQWARHRRIALWTFPLWLYVSITGVVIYWMLYHIAPHLRH